MKILIKNCNLISMDENREKIEYDIDILIDNNIIIKIGKNLELRENQGKIINAKDNYVLPGLINTHAHIPMSIFRESVDGYHTQEWLEDVIWPIEDKLNEEDIYKASLLSCVEMIKTGTTTVQDFYFHPESIVKAVLQSGVRAEITRVVMDSIGSGEKRLEELEKFINLYNNEYETITTNVAIHGLYTNSQRHMQKAIKIAEKNDLNIQIHYCENKKERDEIKSKHNISKPSELIQKYFAKTNNIFAHCVKLEEEDFNIIKKLKINVSHCPISNLKLGCGIADVQKMIESNINVSLGTDGQGSGCNLDMFETMKFTGLLQKGIKENPKLLPAYEILKMATINGAKALRKDKVIGSISEQKLADIIILDLSDVLLQPINNVFSNIIYNAKGYNVKTTIINGKILMENRKLVNLNQEEIIKSSIKILKNKQ